ncbi:adenylate/guanylate cyclase domain-containing response regulator [Plebeiibacterium marinum]|uniref:adenylate cyclase n=1 Tax=Plebeiibacterium marinum TaxID=2992111 RepID=A0AAE3MG91_9BACT|nr:adenylate/guanylate cyclase domain-containing response regulator [Plebeiobacterium marinum]MCW3807283.1 adenylate/guanylate cyclase domain-containing response regulator [Plebeiobacterium marinum]
MDTVKILAIGNDKINLQIIKSRLLEFGDDWLIFNMGCEDAHHAINKSKFDLCIIDCSETSEMLNQKISEIKNSTKNADTPILVSIQECSASDIEEFLLNGALDFIKKPFKSIELFARVRTALTLSSTIAKLNRQNRVINESQEKIEEMIKGLMPSEIINEITRYGESKPKKYRDASVLFADLVDFTKKSRTLSPKVVIDELSEIFEEFDKIMKKNQCTRIKTMGDGYLAVSGIPTPNKDHAKNLIQAAIDMREFLKQRNLINKVKWDIKVGINSGEVIGSVLGKSNYLFDVFGDTVNEASRMENTCEPNQVNISQTTYLITRNSFRYIERLPAEVKGIGKKRMYYLKSSINPILLNDKKKHNLKLGKLIEKLSTN